MIAVSNLWTADVFSLYLYSLPAVIGGSVLGGLLHRIVPDGKFDRLVHVLLVVVGAGLVVRTVWF